MTGLAIHLLQEVIAKEAVALVLQHLLLPLVEVVAVHQVVAIHPEVAAALQVEVVIPLVEIIAHREVEGKF